MDSNRLNFCFFPASLLTCTTISLEGFSGPSNTESQKVRGYKRFKNFRQLTTMQENRKAILVLLQGANPYSNSVKGTVLSINKTLAGNQNIANYTGMESICQY